MERAGIAKRLLSAVGTRLRWRPVLRSAGLCLLYAAVLILVLAAVRSEKQGSGQFRINFAYRVF